MEPVGAVASVLTVVTAAVHVTKALHDILVDIKDAPKDIARLCDDVHSISTLLSSLEDTLKHEPYRRTLEEESPIIRSLEQLEAPLKGCTRIIEAIQIKIAPFSHLQNTVKASRLSKTRWWFHKNATKELIDTFESTKQTLNIHLANISLQCNLCTVVMGAQPQLTDPALRREASTATDAGFALRRYIEAASSIADDDTIGPSENDPDDAVEAFASSIREPPKVQELQVQELLQQAVILGRANLVRPLLARGAYLRNKAEFGRPLLFTAIEGGHEEVVKVILEEAANMSPMGVLYETDAYRQKEYEEALWAAVSNRQIGVVKMLLAAQPRLPLWWTTTTTLVQAVIMGATEIAQMLIENGAAVEVDQYLSQEWVPLHRAADPDRVRIDPKKLLAYSRAEAERGNQSPTECYWFFNPQMGPLSCAVRARHGALVDDLLNAGADPRQDLSMLYDVEPSVIARLLAADAKLHPNSENTLLDIPMESYRDTLLGIAARLPDVPRVKELLRLGANPAARNKDGMTPREIANGVRWLKDTADVEKVLAEAEEVYYGHRIPIVHNGYSC
ncbi:MAG: hypothetical protein Q9172_007684 [Xanthocarpia lactea]